MRIARTALVTGAGRGLGFALVKELLASDYTVFAGRRSEQGDFLDSLPQEDKERLHIVPLDIANDESVRAATVTISGEKGHLDLVFNNVGVSTKHKPTINQSFDMEELIRLFNINALGALRVTSMIMPLLLCGSLRTVVTISSEAGSLARMKSKNWYGYSMSKAALNMQSILVHNDLREQGGRVLIFHPGWMQTYINGELDTKASYTPEFSAKKIIELMHAHIDYNGDQPAFLDIHGQQLPW
ncbi:SDR family oxidoreductase [Paenibacillus luteus]|uniref:SDR family oxidoreductase n=1 Tax=Paenibacillus luteus TaxID=2545753 RepID=UPI001F4F76BD|nr:SDR family oxidoreductase [Paenibacillus luteus]